MVWKKGKPRSEEDRRKKREAALHRWSDPLEREKQSKRMKEVSKDPKLKSLRRNNMLRLYNEGKLNNKGENNPMYGKKRPDTANRMLTNNPAKRPEIRRKISRIRKEKFRNGELKPPPHLSKYWYGEDNPQWEGGVPSYRGRNWANNRISALKRDKYTCQVCGLSNEECKKKYDKGLSVHHITPFRIFNVPEEANELSNLVTLCVSCHHSNKYKNFMVETR